MAWLPWCQRLKAGKFSTVVSLGYHHSQTVPSSRHPLCPCGHLAPCQQHSVCHTHSRLTKSTGFTATRLEQPGQPYCTVMFLDVSSSMHFSPSSLPLCVAERNCRNVFFSLASSPTLLPRGHFTHAEVKGTQCWHTSPEHLCP